MKPRTGRTAPALIALAASSLVLAACTADGNGDGDAGEATTSAAVSVDPDAPELDEHEGSFNFVEMTDDGRSHILGFVRVLSNDGWLGLEDGEVEFTALDDGEYRVIARGASGCPGVGETTDDGLGVVGEIHAADGSAEVWGTPTETEVDSFSTVVLADSDDTVLSCGKSVDWTEPTTTSETTSATTSATTSTSATETS